MSASFPGHRFLFLLVNALETLDSMSYLEIKCAYDCFLFESFFIRLKKHATAHKQHSQNSKHLEQNHNVLALNKFLEPYTTLC
jgi:hypothetical protein